MCSYWHSFVRTDTHSFGSDLIIQIKGSKFEPHSSGFGVWVIVSRTPKFVLHFFCESFLSLFLLFLCVMGEFSVIMYLVNAVIFTFMIFLTFIEPSLLNSQYWVYILIGFFTAIVFHSGYESGKSKWYTTRYASLWLFTSFSVGFTFFQSTLVVPFMRPISCLSFSLFGFFTRISYIFSNILTCVTFYSSILSHFPYHFLFFIHFLSDIIIILLLLT